MIVTGWYDEPRDIPPAILVPARTRPCRILLERVVHQEAGGVTASPRAWGQ
jgi:hypothetical protein